MIGLVLGGGGAKGAYQAGVWKALHEIQIPLPDGSHRPAAEFIGGIIGSSVGSLNAMLFAACTPEQVYEVWKNLKREDFYSLRQLKLDKTEKPKHRRLDAGARLAIGAAEVGLLHAIFPGFGLQHVLLTYFFLNGSPFTQAGLKQILDDRIADQPLRCPVYAVCTENVMPRRIDIFSLEDYDRETQKKIVIASANMPFLYAGAIGIEIDGKRYIDGGVIKKYKIPTDEMHALGYDRTITVCCSKQESPAPPTLQHVEISPSEDNGGVIRGTLALTHMQRKINRNLLLGMADARANRDAIVALILEDLKTKQS